MAVHEDSVLLVTGGYDHHIRFWEASTALSSHTIQYNDSQLNALVISPDKRFLAAAGMKSVKLFDIARAQPVSANVLEKANANFVSVGFQREGKWLFTGSQDGAIRIWDRKTKNPHFDFHSPSKSPINSAILHPNQVEIIAAYQDGYIRVWDLTTRTCRVEILPDPKAAPIRSLSIAQDASLFVCSNDKGVCFVYESNAESIEDQNSVWELKKTRRISAHNTYCLKTVLSPDCRYLATTSADKTVKIWDCKNNFDELQTLEGHQRWVWDAAFSADSAYLVTASTDTTAKLWELASGSPILEYQGHSKGLTCVALNDCSS